MTTPPAASPDVDAWLAANDLADRLNRGLAPPAIARPVASPRGEVAHAHVPAQCLWFGGTEVTYTEHQLLAFGGLVTLAITAAASAISNRRRRAQAQTLAAPQWLPFGDGRVLVTNRRVLLGASAGVSVWFQSIGQLRADIPAGRLELVAEGHPHYGIGGPWAPYVYVLVRHLAGPRPFVS